jgi:RNA polymerase sigma factor (TIGR02999 family)
MADVTRLLNDWQQGNRGAFDELSAIIYTELHRIAESYLRRSPQATFQPTALVNEAYIRLAGHESAYHDRKHFYALAAQMMRHVLVDRVRAQQSAKRGGGMAPETLDEIRHGVPHRLDEFLILDEVLTRLSQAEPRLSQIIELHYFGGLTGAEIADLMGISASTVSREQRLAEAWLRQALSQNT